MKNIIINILFYIIILLLIKNNVYAQNNFAKYKVGNDVFTFYDDGKVTAKGLDATGTWVDDGTFIMIQIFSWKFEDGMSLMAYNTGLGEKENINIFDVNNPLASITMKLISTPVHFTSNLEHTREDNAANEYSSGLKFLQANYIEKAINKLSYALSLNPSGDLLSKIYFARAKAYFISHNKNLSFADINEALINDSLNSEMFFFRAGLFFSDKKINESLSDYNNAIKLDSSNFKYYEERVQIFVGMNDSVMIFHDCNKAIELGSKQNNIYLLRAKSNFFRKKYEQTISDCSVILSSPYSHPHSDVLMLRADSYYLLNDFGRAQKDYEANLAYENSSECRLGFIYLEKKNFTESKKYFNKASSDNWYANLGLALLSFELKNFESAKEHYDLAIKNQPKLKKGLEGIKDIEEYKYFTKNQTEVFKKIEKMITIFY